MNRTHRLCSQSAVDSRVLALASRPVRSQEQGRSPPSRFVAQADDGVGILSLIEPKVTIPAQMLSMQPAGNPSGRFRESEAIGHRKALPAGRALICTFGLVAGVHDHRATFGLWTRRSGRLRCRAYALRRHAAYSASAAQGLPRETFRPRRLRPPHRPRSFAPPSGTPRLQRLRSRRSPAPGHQLCSASIS